MTDTMQSQSQAHILNIEDWKPTANKFMAMKKNDRGGGTVNIINEEKNRAIHLKTPPMMTWGIAEPYVDKVTGEASTSNKYKIPFNFPTGQYSKPDTDELLNKMKEFEDSLLDAAVENSEAWFGKKLKRDICEDRFFPSIKYKKNKETGELERPYLQLNILCYDGNWKIHLYEENTLKEMFPNPVEPQDPPLGPMDLIPSKSYIRGLIICSGLWIAGGKWGVSWKLDQAIVKQRSNRGSAPIDFCVFDSQTSKLNVQNEQPTEEEEVTEVQKEPVKEPVTTVVADSDEEEEEEAEPEPEPEPTPVIKKTKKVVKKKA